MRRRFGRQVAVVVAVVVVGCSPAAGRDGAPPSSPAGGSVIVARDLAFDRARLETPAGAAFELLFDNRDGVLHNVAILDRGDGHAVFVGEIFGGPGARTYRVPAIAAGTYAFRCDVHPDMAGTLVAGPPR